MSRETTIQAIKENKIIVIIRGLNDEQLVKGVEAMVKGGIKLVELPFDATGKTPNEEICRQVKLLKDTFAGQGVHIGVGTVLNPIQVELAKEAGAEYIISPDCYDEVIKLTRKLDLVSIPGCFTPSEATAAHRYGADFIKLFPNSEVKLSYFKALSLPLAHLSFLAVGGVNADNFKEYLNAGVAGIGVATAIVNKTLIKEGKYEEITKLAQSFTCQLGGNE